MNARWLKLVREQPVCYPRLIRRQQIKTCRDVFSLLQPVAIAEPVEVFIVIALDGHNHILAATQLTRGNVSNCIVSAREIFQWALYVDASAVLLVHNHPSGVPHPSVDDRARTREVIEAGKLLDIDVFDHVIITPEKFFSFAEAGLL